ncbi:MAG: hypothetical protein DRI84_01755 [Bacteroidetes bacterium]|nr:MAG: hypothetical protein DRI84_01755 [Bacteroidota bacterium]
MKSFKQLVFILLFLFSFQGTWAQYERGILPIKTYGTKEYNGLQQIFDIRTDSRGVVYAGNGVGLLELSGNAWKVYKVNNKSNVRSIAIDPMGRIFVGAHGEFGYFGIDSSKKGILSYHILSNQISNSEDADFSNVKYTSYHDNKVYFQTDHKIFIWDYDSIRVIHSKNKLTNFFFVSGQIFTTVVKEGYFSIGDSLTLAYESVDNNIAANLIPFDDNSSLFFRKGKGFHLVTYQNNSLRIAKKIPTQIDSILTKVKVSSLLKLSSDLFAVGTNSGIFILNRKGKLLRIISKASGLKSDYVTCMSIASDKRLWVGSEEGIAVVSVFSAIEYFPQKSCNYDGRIINIQRFGGKIYIITNSGLYKMDENISKYSNQINSDVELDKLSLSKFHPFEIEKKKQLQSLRDSLVFEFSNPCWDLAEFHYGNKNILLVSTQNYIVGVSEQGEVEKVATCYPYDSYQSKVDPRRVYIGLDGGIQSVYYGKNGKWINEGLIEGINEIIVDIAEDTLGNLWLTSMQRGVVKVEQPVFENHKIKDPKIIKLKKGLDADGLVMIGAIDRKIYFPASYGIYSYSNTDSSFILNPTFGRQVNNKKNIVFDLSQDEYSNVWVIANVDSTTQIGSILYLKKNAENNFQSQKIFAIRSEVVYDFHHDEKNITWFGGTFGLCKTDASKFEQSSPIYHTFLNMVLNNTDTAFGGYFVNEDGVSLSQPESFIYTFDYSHNSFTFYFSAMSPNDLKKLKYSWYLEGYDKEKTWGSWSDKTYKEYTNLYEGNYILHIRAIDIYGNVSKESSYEFTINPPWFRAVWAFIGYILFFIAFVWGAIRVSTRSLKRIIKEATAEIMEQKDQLEEKNRNIIDSIRYAQRIQEAVIPSESQFHSIFEDSFVLWKPRDIVSGDFYWMMQREDQLFVCAADCTGHGVPGAFMSIMGISFLNQIAGLPNVKNAADALNLLRNNVITSLNKEGSHTATKDGMDIALCVFNMKKMQVDYAGAYNALYIIREGELLETKADRMPIGVHDRDNLPFTNKTLDLMSGDQIYMFSDGYIDQFGGPKGKKFMSKRFKKFLLEIQHLPMQEQKDRLWENNLAWRGEIEQVDDIILLGIRIQ